MDNELLTLVEQPAVIVNVRKSWITSSSSLAILIIALLLLVPGHAFADGRNEQSGKVLRVVQQINDGFDRIAPIELERIERKWNGPSIRRRFPVGVILPGIGLLLFLIVMLSLWNWSLRRAMEIRTRALKANEQRYRLLFNAESNAIVVVDLECLRLIEVNEAAVELYGYSNQELINMRITDLSTEPEESLRRLASQDDHIVIPLSYHRKKNGQMVPVEITVRFFQLEGHRRLLASMRDISARLKAEEALRENRRFLGDLIENSGTQIFAKDLRGRYTLVNRKWEEVTGIQRDSAIGRTDEELFSGETGRQFRQNDVLVMDSGQALEKEEVLEQGQNRRYSLSVKFPLRNDDGAVYGICGMSTDITAHKQAEGERERLNEQLAQAYKMESIGRLAGGVAHDFNNMLGVILGHIELAMLQALQSGPLQASLKEIEKAARRSADLTRQLLAFARKQTIVPRTIDLNEIVNGMLTLLRRLIGEDIELVWHPGCDLWSIKMDPSQLDQILANLCANARDAIEGVGRIVITTENIHVGTVFCLDHEGCREGDFVVLAISDTGCGMDEETRTKLFEPFFTTKELGKGTGLGLAMVYGIVRQNNGFVTVESSPGKGSCFRLFFPCHEVADPSHPEENKDKLLSGTETILLVEDEQTVLVMTSQMLAHLGYRVIKAGSPSEAIRLAKASPEPIDLLLTDVVMPEMNGWDLAKALQPIQPAMKQLFTSGYTATSISQPHILDSGVRFIQKPFTMQDLSRTIREALRQ